MIWIFYSYYDDDDDFGRTGRRARRGTSVCLLAGRSSLAPTEKVNSNFSSFLRRFCGGVLLAHACGRGGGTKGVGGAGGGGGGR